MDVGVGALAIQIIVSHYLQEKVGLEELVETV